MVGIPSAVNAAQEIAAEISPAPVGFDRIASAQDVIARLQWGRPDLTIIDVRDRTSFNTERITGAVLIDRDQLISQVSQLAEQNRDIYVYGQADQSIINAATQLDRAGFKRVAILEGGLSAWKSAQGPTEGRHA